MQTVKEKEYIYNEKLAISQLKAEYGEEDFNSLPDKFKQGLIKERRKNLNSEYEKEMEEYWKRHNARTEAVLKQFSDLKLSFTNSEIGYTKSYHRFKSISLGFKEDSLSLEHPYLTLEGRIKGFHKSQILGLKNRMLETMEEADSYEPKEKFSISYAYFRVFNGNTVVGSTKTQYIVKETIDKNINNLWNNFENLITTFEDHHHNYEFLFAQEQQSCNVVIYFTSLYFPKPQSVSNWGDNLEPVIKFPFFDLFTANDHKIDCIMQCASFLGMKKLVNSLNDISEYFNNKLLIFNLADHIEGIKEIKDYGDLRIDPDSPIKEFHTINPVTKYLIKHNGHIGVLFNLRKQKFNSYLTLFSPMAFKNVKSKSVTVCFDIECYFDPKVEKDQRHIPYLACACFVIENKPSFMIEEEGENCVFDLIDRISSIAKQNGIKNVELVAHNGGNYDFHYIISNMYNPRSIKNILMRNNAFISFEFKHKTISFNVKDSYAFLLCSLANAAKAFDIEGGKTDFPHHEVKSADDLQRVFQKWESVDTIIDANIEKQKMLIRAEHFIRYDDHEDSRKLIDWAKDYCINDVIVLANVWIKFKSATLDIFGAHIVDQTKTLAGLSFKLFESFLAPDIELYHPQKDDYLNIREALIGGRCISVNGIHKDVLCLDVKSLYPAAMAYYDQPYGRMFKVKDRNPDKLGVYYCKVIANKTNNHGYFPIRYDKSVVYTLGDTIEYEAWYTSVDIDIGISEGHNIEVLHGYEWEHKGKIFKDYIEQVLYKYKLQFEQENNKVKRQVIKIIMNSLWGKFAQKWIDTEYSILNIQDAEDKEGYIIWDTDYMLIKEHIDKDIGSKPVQNGVFTLSWARYHLKQLWDKGAKPGAICLYSDTDSICVAENQFNLEADIIGSEMGQLELEHTFYEMVCVGKKQYMGAYIKDEEIQYKKRFKGVPLQYITPDLYIHLLNNHKAEIQFLKFRREWGTVRGYIESKNVQMT